MRLYEIGFRVRQARLSLAMTQAALAAAAGVGRSTLVRFENGALTDLGIAKVLAIADVVGLELAVVPSPERPTPDYIAIATTAANTGFRKAIAQDELIRALLTGRPPDGGRPHLRRLLEESPPTVIHGLLHQLSQRSKPGRLAANLERLAREVGVAESKVAGWKTRA